MSGFFFLPFRLLSPLKTAHLFAVLRTYDNYIPANMMLQRLEEENIRAYLQDEHTVTIDPILTNAIGGIKLMVHQEQLARALELVNGFEHVYQQAVACAKCGSTNVYFVTQRSNPMNWFSAIFSWLFGSYAMPVKSIYHCFDCGFEFEEIPESGKGNPQPASGNRAYDEADQT